MISVEEVSSQTGHQPVAIRGWMDKLKIKQREDWTGRPAVAEEDATRIFLAIREAGRENAQLTEDYENYRKDWERRKHDAGEEAFVANLRQHLANQHAAAARIDQDETYAFYGGLGATTLPVGGSAYTAANEAAHEARAQSSTPSPNGGRRDDDKNGSRDSRSLESVSTGPQALPRRALLEYQASP